MSNVWKRALTILVAAPFIVFVIEYGGIAFFLFAATGGFVACLEYEQMMKQLDHQFPLGLLLVGAIGQWVIASLNYPAYQPIWLFASIFINTIYFLWGYETGRFTKVVESWTSLTFGVLLLGWMFSHVFWLRTEDPLQGVWTGIVLLAIWGADSFAYGVGRFLAGRFGLGRHSLTQRLSPRKTFEGYIGGIIFGTLLTVGIGTRVFNLPWSQLTILSLALTVLCIVGDLGISILKRETQMKDSGQFLPGHGGALDRIDTLLWGVPLGYYLLLLLQVYH